MAEVWEHRKYDHDDSRPYGQVTTYEKGFGWLLEECEFIEDWGCGSAWGRQYVPAGHYRGIDGSPEAAHFADVVSDLRYYQSPGVDGIFMRHILEHNLDWHLILDNAIKSFRKRYCLVLFTPFSEQTRRLTGNGLYDLSFRKDELTDRFGPDVTWTDEHLETATQYGVEHMFFIERPAGWDPAKAATQASLADS